MLALAGCAGQSIPSPSNTAGLLEALPPIRYKRNDLCSAQRGIAEHNSRWQTLKTGKETVYRAPCDTGKARRREGKDTSAKPITSAKPTVATPSKSKPRGKSKPKVS